jgi:hypothetical protein
MSRWAFVGTSPTDDSITSGSPAIQEEQTVKASCAFFPLLAVDRPTSVWRQA